VLFAPSNTQMLSNRGDMEHNIDMEHNYLKRGPHEVSAHNSFLYKQRSEEELGEYDAGYKAGSKGLALDARKDVAWRSGWSEAQEYELRFSWSA
jgi:hypothetical protein